MRFVKGWGRQAVNRLSPFCAKGVFEKEAAPPAWWGCDTFTGADGADALGPRREGGGLTRGGGFLPRFFGFVNERAAARERAGGGRVDRDGGDVVPGSGS